MGRLLGDLLVAATLILLLAIPKSGLYVGEIPLYFIYVLIAASIGVLWVWKLLIIVKWGHVQSAALTYVALLTPFWVLWLYTFAMYGYESIGLLAGHVFTIFVLPIFFLGWTELLDSRRERVFSATFIWSVRVAVIFGIISFVAAAIYGDYINVPYVTIAGGDAPMEAWQKNNRRGELFKLISTYSNGNIYGICMMMLAPLYVALEKRSLLKIAFLASVVLTLSRTVWVLVLFFGVLHLIHRGTLRQWVLVVASGAVIAVSIFFLSSELGGADFLFDESLGDRSKYFWKLEYLRLFPAEKISSVTEIPYVSIYYDFGLVGVICFACFLAAPILVRCRSEGDRTLQALNSGLLLYLVASTSDAAFLFVPTFAVYSFLAGLKFQYLSKLASFRRQHSI